MVKRALVTLACGAAYVTGRTLPLPLVDLSVRFPDGLQFPVLRLGLAPFVIAFVLVELFSLTPGPGLLWRRHGREGRRRLTGIAIVLGTVFTLVQATALADSLGRALSPWGTRPSLAPTLVLAITLAAGAFVVLGLAALISALGLGNGFAVILGIDVLLHVRSFVLAARSGDHELAPEWWLMSTLLTAAVVLAVGAFLKRRPAVELATPEGARLPHRLTPLPQGLPAVVGSYALVSLIADLLALRPLGTGLATAAAILLLSLLLPWALSSRARVQANLGSVATVPRESFEPAWRRQWILATLLLVLGQAALALIWESSSTGVTVLLSLNDIIVLAAVSLDLWDEAALLRTGPLTRVLTLDNVHLAEYLQARFAEDEIPCVVRAYRFRRLLFFFGALFKMALLVPEADAERAARLVGETPFEIV